METFSDISMTHLVPEALALGTIPVPDSDRITETVVVVVVVVRGARMLSVPIPDTQTPVPETLDSGAAAGVVSVQEDGLTPVALAMVGIRSTVEEREAVVVVVVVVVAVDTTSSRAVLTPGWALLSPSLPGMWRTLFFFGINNMHL